MKKVVSIANFHFLNSHFILTHSLTHSLTHARTHALT